MGAIPTRIRQATIRLCQCKRATPTLPAFSSVVRHICSHTCFLFVGFGEIRFAGSGAVGEDGQYAGYSDRNSKVDLVAPGTNILSTVRMEANENRMASIAFTTLDGQKATVGGMLTPRSRTPSSTISGPLFACTDPTCTGSPGGHACIVERGLNVYSVLAKWCQDSGGIAVLIYHGEKNGYFSGDLIPHSLVTIPVVALTRTDGMLLLNGSKPGSAVSIRAQVGYSFMSGTSMACPAVAGALVALWQVCPACDSYELERCAYIAALDLGEPGRDELYGYGVIQTSSALSCLQHSCC
jgi:subtilisin family serine protease